MSENIYKIALKRMFDKYGILLALIFVALLIISTWVAKHSLDKAGVFFSIIGVLFPICIILFAISIDKVRVELYTQLAKELNLSYFRNKDNKFTHPFLEKNLHIEHLLHIMYGTLENESFLYSLYTYTVGSGKHSKTYTYSVIMIDLPVSVPHIIISDSGHDFTFGLPYPQSLHLPSHMRKVTLEGNFSKERDVYVEVEHEIEAYQLLSPDTMSFLLDHIEDVEIELVENKLFVYKTHEMNRKSEILDFISLYKTLYTQIKRTIPSIQKH